MVPLSFTPENIITVVVALLVLLGSWVTSRTRKRGDAESNVMNRLETMLVRSDEEKRQMRDEMNSFRDEAEKANRNIAKLQRFSIDIYAYVVKHLPDAKDIPDVPELET